jgi:hypothetical protein
VLLEQLELKVLRVQLVHKVIKVFKAQLVELELLV